MSLTFTDNHCHLLDPRLEGRGGELLSRAVAAGVTRLAVNGTCEADWPGVERLWRENAAHVLPSFGLHPLYVPERSENWLATLEETLRRVPSGVGEVGLDFKYVEAAPGEQEEVLRAQMELAARLGRPVSIHCIGAWEPLLAILGEGGLPAAGVVIHGFMRSREVVERCLALGCWVSFAGSVLYTDRRRAQEALCIVPADRLLVESDAPDLAPPPEFRGPGTTFDSEPASVPLVVRGLAELRSEPVDLLVTSLAANAYELWGGLAGLPD